jgi:two-component system, cell cycle sensor histidine kinase and response regulator CckA
MSDTKKIRLLQELTKRNQRLAESSGSLQGLLPLPTPLDLLPPPSQSTVRLAAINHCFLRFGPDPAENINRLTALCGELLGGTCALYNRLEGGLICSLGQWNAPPDYVPVDEAEGHICYDVIKHSKDAVFIVNHLPQTSYARTDPNVLSYSLQTYVGHPVKCGGQVVGSLCVVFQEDLQPTAEDQRLMGILASAIGIEEERMKAGQELRESEVRYRLLVENSPLGVMTIDAVGRILDVNAALVKILGSPSSESTRAINMFTFAPLVQSGITADLQRCLENGEPIIGEKAYRTKWGVEVFPRYHCQPLRNEEGEVVSVLAIVEDFSAHRRAEQEKARLEDQLREAQKMEAISLLAGGVAHDINNVLASIMGLASVLQLEVDPDDPKHPDIEGIIESCKKGRDLTRNLLGFAQRGKYLKEKLSLNQIVLQVKEELERRSPENVRIRTDLLPQLEVVEGDPGQITHALLNIGFNAIDAINGAGTITLTTCNLRLMETDRLAHPHLKPGSYVQIQVNDSGVGMDPSVLARVFEPFFTTKPKGKGVGLGLSMVYGTVKNHHGMVSLTSEVGMGTAVTVLLPAVSVRTPAKLTPQPSAAEPKAGGLVLLVDDEEMIRYAGKKMLQALGYQVVLAKHGKEAVEIYERQHDEIALVVLDLVMPVMDGEETLPHLLAINPRARVLLSSGFSQEEKANQLIKAGAAGFVQKPFDLQMLAEKMR